MIKLSKRLQALAALVPCGQKAADIGTDHGLLPGYLIKAGISPLVIAVDVKKGPLEAAEKNIFLYQVQDQVDLRLGDGLTVLAPGEVETVIIAGMGGGTIRDILNGSPQVVESLKRLVLQPMNGAAIVRKWSQDKGWAIVTEDLVSEEGRIYEIIVLEKGKAKLKPLSAMEMEYGPFLIQNRHPLLLNLLEKELASLQEIQKQLKNSSNVEAQAKSLSLEAKKKQIKELQECLSVVKP